MKGKTIRVVLEPPITEYCRKCDYEAHYSFNSHHVKCPECGESSISSGMRPKYKPVFVTANYGRYDFANLSHKQWNYTFHNMPEELKGSFTVDEELDYSYPLDLACELDSIYEGYLFSSSKEKIKKIKKWLEENDDIQDAISRKKRILELKRDLYKELARISDDIPGFEGTLESLNSL